MTNKTTTPDKITRWTAKRRTELVLEILRGQTTASQAARQHDLKLKDIERWQKDFLNAGENALRSNPRNDLELKQKEIDELYKEVGKLTLQDKIHRTVYKKLGVDPFASENSSQN